VWNRLTRLKINEKTFTSDVRCGHFQIDETLLGALTNKNIQSLMLAFYTFDSRDFNTRNSVKTRLSAYSAVSSSAKDSTNSAGIAAGRAKDNQSFASSSAADSNQSPNKRTRLSQDLDVSVVREMIKKAVAPIETELKAKKLSKLSTSVASVEKQQSELKDSLKSLQTSVHEKAGDRNTINKKALKEVEDDLKKQLVEMAESNSEAFKSQNLKYQELQRELGVKNDALTSLQQSYSELARQFSQSQQEFRQQMDNHSQQIQFLQRTLSSPKADSSAGHTAHQQNDQPNQNSFTSPSSRYADNNQVLASNTAQFKHTNPFAQLTHSTSSNSPFQPTPYTHPPVQYTTSHLHIQPITTTPHQPHTNLTQCTTQPHTQLTQNTLEQSSVQYTPSHLYNHSMQNTPTPLHTQSTHSNAPQSQIVHCNVIPSPTQFSNYSPTEPHTQPTPSQVHSQPTAQYTPNPYITENLHYSPSKPPTQHNITNQPRIQPTHYTSNQHISQHAHFALEQASLKPSLQYIPNQQHTIVAPYSHNQSSSVFPPPQDCATGADPKFNGRTSQPQAVEAIANQQSHGQQQQGAPISYEEVVRFMKLIQAQK